MIAPRGYVLSHSAIVRTLAVLAYVLTFAFGSAAVSAMRGCVERPRPVEIAR